MNVFVIRDDTFTDKNGELVTIKRDRVALRKDAYPTIIGEIAPHLTEKLPKKRKTIDDREEHIRKALANSLQSYSVEKVAASIKRIEDIIKYISNNCKDEGWGYAELKGTLIICHLNYESHNIPKLMASIKVQKDLSYSVYIDNVEISYKQLEKANINFNFITETYNIDALINYCNKLNMECGDINYLEMSIELLEKHKEIVMDIDKR